MGTNNGFRGKFTLVNLHCHSRKTTETADYQWKSSESASATVGVGWPSFFTCIFGLDVPTSGELICAAQCRPCTDGAGDLQRLVRWGTMTVGTQEEEEERKKRRRKWHGAIWQKRKKKGGEGWKWKDFGLTLWAVKLKTLFFLAETNLRVLGCYTKAIHLTAAPVWI